MILKHFPRSLERILISAQSVFKDIMYWTRGIFHLIHWELHNFGKMFKTCQGHGQWVQLSSTVSIFSNYQWKIGLKWIYSAVSIPMAMENFWKNFTTNGLNDNLQMSGGSWPLMVVNNKFKNVYITKSIFPFSAINQKIFQYLHQFSLLPISFRKFSTN